MSTSTPHLGPHPASTPHLGPHPCWPRQAGRDLAHGPRPRPRHAPQDPETWSVGAWPVWRPQRPGANSGCVTPGGGPGSGRSALWPCARSHPTSRLRRAPARLPGAPPAGAEGLLRLHGALLGLEPEVLHVLPELLEKPLLHAGAQPLAPPVCRDSGRRRGGGQGPGGREAFRRRGEEAPRWRPDCGGTGSPKTEPDPLGPQGATPAHADHTGGLGVPHTDPRWPEAVPSTCAAQAAPHPLTGGTGPSGKELSGLTPRTLGDSQRGSASGTVPWWVQWPLLTHSQGL